MAVTCTTYKNGTKFWENERGQWHREDGPAVEFAGGGWFWSFEGKSHRICGPSNWANRRYYWWVNGHAITDLVRECLAQAPDLPEDVHLGILAKRMLELNDDRLWERVKPWL